eukprot:767965-Hanusia_phi.AAC.3
MVEFFPPAQQNATASGNGDFIVLPNTAGTDQTSSQHVSDDQNHYVRSKPQLEGNHFHQDEIERSKWEIHMKYQQHLQEKDAYLHLDLDMDQFRHIVHEEMLSKALNGVADKVAPNTAERNAQKSGSSKLRNLLRDYEEVSLKRIFGGFSRTSPIRIKCYQIVTSKEWNSIFLIATVLNSVSIALTPEFSNSPETTKILDIVGYACVLAFMFEVMCGIIAYGFWQGPTTYLNLSDFNRLDFFLLITLTAEYVAEFGLKLHGPSIRSFRLLRLLKYMMRMRLFSSVRAMIQTLRQGMSQILIVTMVLAFFVAMFGIFGMAIYQNSFARRCLMTARNVPSAVCASDFSNNWSKTCSFNESTESLHLGNGSIAVYPGYPWKRWCKIYCKDPATCPQYAGVKPQDARGWYHSCQEQVDLNNDGVINATDLLHVDQYCESIGNPQYGLQNFDSLGGVIPTILQVAAPDSAYDVILESLQSEPSAIILTWIFFIAITVLCTFLILGLFVAVVTGTFARVRERHGSISFEDSIEDETQHKHVQIHADDAGATGEARLERQRTSQTFPTREELGIKSTIDAEADDGDGCSNDSRKRKFVLHGNTTVLKLSRAVEPSGSYCIVDCSGCVHHGIGVSIFCLWWNQRILETTKQQGRKHLGAFEHHRPDNQLQVPDLPCGFEDVSAYDLLPHPVQLVGFCYSKRRFHLQPGLLHRIDRLVLCGRWKILVCRSHGPRHKIELRDVLELSVDDLSAARGGLMVERAV